MQEKKRKVGRPKGSTRGRKDRITINIDDDNLAWLRKQYLSYSKIINRLLKKEVEK